ncbi:MAG: tyrosine-protein kinase [Actinomycetota bacterium]|jgi:capsular exopolysaccharide synthesis family protein|nr:tyrosine-protein kinase [Actinomycetota bacterium]MEA2588920.1 tyrosine-protein kinase [Actinomycetota bacterium]
MPESSIRTLVVAVRRRLVLALLVFIVVCAIGTYLGTKRQPLYRATSTVLILPGTNPNIAYQDAVKILLPTISVQLSSRSFLAGSVAPLLPFKISADDLSKQVHGELLTNGGALNIVGMSNDPKKAAQLSVAATEAFLTSFAGNTSLHLQASDLASPPQGPSGPGQSFVLAVSILVGLVLATGAALGWERAFPKIRTLDDLEEVSDLPVLGRVPSVRLPRAERRPVLDSPSLAEVQAGLRGTSMELHFAMRQAGLKSVLVAGVEPGSGASTVAACLSVLLADLNLRVVLVDADLAHATQHEIFGVTNGRGFSSVLQDIDPKEMLRGTTVPGLALVTAGPRPAGPRQEGALYRRLTDLLPEADVVVLDGSPLGRSPDTHLLAYSVGAVLLVMEAGQMSPRAFRRAVEKLERVGVRPLGALLTKGRRAGRTAKARHKATMAAPLRRGAVTSPLRAPERRPPERYDALEWQRSALAQQAQERNGDGPPWERTATTHPREHTGWETNPESTAATHVSPGGNGDGSGRNGSARARELGRGPGHDWPAGPTKAIVSGDWATWDSRRRAIPGEGSPRGGDNPPGTGKAQP